MNFEDLTLTNDWMFKEVMQDKENLPIIKEFLEMLLKTKIYKITPVQTEVEEKPEFDSHGVRFDCQFIKDGVITVVEMQTYSDNLPLRAKYYHDLIDVRNYPPGDDKFENVPSTLIIFILTGDYLEHNLQKYTVKSMIQENPQLKYDDKRTTIFLNPKVSTKDKRLNNFCDFLLTGQPKDSLTDGFSKAIDKIKSNPLKRSNFMSIEMNRQHDIKVAKEEGIKEGIKEGIQKGKEIGKEEQKVEIAKNLLLMNLSSIDISKATGLSIDKINEFKNTLKDK